MRRFVVAGLAGLWLGAVMAEEKKDERPAVRALDMKVQQPANGKATAPTVLATAAELNKALGDDAAAVQKLVNFETEKVVYFAWSGSGQDRVTPAAPTGKGREVTFNYTQGRTRDFRPHHWLFAVPRDATVKVVPVDR
jgi:hypothetical protein